VADKVLCDVAIIHHVEESTRRKLDLRAFQCWAFSKDPSMIPWSVFLTLTHQEVDPFSNAQVHFVRPRNMKNAHVFKILIHIDVVEDLMFYHYPREELLADGKVPWRDFSWQYGLVDGDTRDDEGDEDFHPLPCFCANDVAPWHRKDEDDDDRDQQRPKSRSILRRVPSWMEGRGRGRSRNNDRHRESGWYRGESSRTRNGINL
jgi:hypothetical protein